jgi:hypothetical protein
MFSLILCVNLVSLSVEDVSEARLTPGLFYINYYLGDFGFPDEFTGLLSMQREK